MNDTESNVIGSSGIELFDSLKTVWNVTPFGRHLGIKLIEVGDGFAVFEGFPVERFYNPQGVIHGGFHASLIDSAMGCAVQTTLGKIMNYGTIELKVNYVRAVLPATGRVLCRATVLHRGRRTSTAEARIVDEADKLYAHGTGTFMVYER